MKAAVTLVLVASARAFAEPVEPEPPAKPAQPTWLVGACIGLIGSVLDSPTDTSWNRAAPLAQLEAGRYVSARAAVVVRVMGALRLGVESTTLGSATLGAEWHMRSVVVGAAAGVFRVRKHSESTYGPTIDLRGGTELPAGPLLVQVMAEISAMPSGSSSPASPPVTFSLSVGVRAQRTR